ncbi:MAG: hypothetical protein GY952_03315 [Rhodobacteraceae bacterium]|nr:hypothetical protein [Paracoccaceae bacterium]
MYKKENALDIWIFLTDSANQKTLAWLGGGICIVVAGLWKALLTLRKKAPQPAPKSPQNSATGRDGITSTGNVRVDGDVTVSNTSVPKGI